MTKIDQCLGLWVYDGVYVFRIRVGPAVYQHPHKFTDKTEASVFAGKVALAARANLDRWIKLGPDALLV